MSFFIMDPRMGRPHLLNSPDLARIEGFWALEYHTLIYTCFLKGTIMKYKFILFSPWLLESPGLVLVMM